jgi:hypothetical protein
MCAHKRCFLTCAACHARYVSVSLWPRTSCRDCLRLASRASLCSASSTLAIRCFSRASRLALRMRTALAAFRCCSSCCLCSSLALIGEDCATLSCEPASDASSTTSRALSGRLDSPKSVASTCPYTYVHAHTRTRELCYCCYSCCMLWAL